MESEKTKKLKKGLIPLIIFLMLFISIFNIPIISATTINYSMDMDDEVVDQQIVSSWINSAPVSVGSQDFNISNSFAFDGTNSFVISEAGGDGWWNYTYANEVDFMSNWSAFFFRERFDDTGGSEPELLFYNSDGALVIHLKFYPHGQNLYFVRHDATEVHFASLSLATWLDIGFSMSSNDSVIYYAGSGAPAPITSTPRNVLDNYAITSLHITNDEGANTNQHDLFIDLHNITVSSRIGEGEGIEGYTVIGDLTGVYSFHNTNSRYLEIQKNTEMSGYIKAIDLYVDSYYIENLGNGIHDLTLKLNGVERGTASSSTLFGAGYIIRWLLDTPQTITEEKILCEFRSLTDNFYVAYADYDIDLDGDQVHCNHNQPNYYDGYYNQFSLVNYDLGYRIWGLFETITPTYDDLVLTSKDTYDQYENIQIITMVSTMDTQNYLHIYDNDSLLTTFVINSYTNSFVYNAETSGHIYLNLTRNSVVVYSKQLNIVSKDYDYLIYTVPNPSTPNIPFDIKYIYNNSVNTGVLYVFNYKYELLDVWSLPINTPSLQTIPYVLTNEGAYYFRMAVNVTYYEKEIKYTHAHYNGISNYANQISVSGETINIGDTAIIYGTHNFLNNNVYVKVGGEDIFYVGSSNTFSFPYIPLKLQVYNCSLILKVSDTQEILLEYTSFTCIGEEVTVPVDYWGLPEEYMNAMFGAFFTLGFLIIPFALSKGKASNIIYAIFGGLGLGISTIMGLFPLWLPFMITVIIVAILIVEYKRK